MNESFYIGIIASAVVFAAIIIASKLMSIEPRIASWWDSLQAAEKYNQTNGFPMSQAQALNLGLNTKAVSQYEQHLRRLQSMAR